MHTARSYLPRLTMPVIMSGLLSPPVFINAAATEQALVFFKVVRTLFVAVTIVMAAGAIAQPGLVWEEAAIALVVGSASALLLEANRRGWTTQASWALVIFAILLVTHRSILAGGIRAPGVTMYFLFTMMAGLLLGERAGIATAMACSGIGLGLVSAERAGFIQVQGFRYTAGLYWLLNCLYMALTVAMLRISSQSLRRAAEQTKTELAERIKAERRLRVLNAAAQLLRDRPFDSHALAEFAALAPQGWMHPKFCEARITYGDLEVATAGWRETPWRQNVEFATSSGAGEICIAYTERCAFPAGGPFEREEQNLLNSLAEMLVAYIERDHSEKHRQIAEARMRQSQKMEAIGSLAGGIAHDFNNLLAAIQGFSRLLEDDLPPHSRQHHFAERISGACDRGKEIVEQILAFARHGSQQPQVIGLSAFLHDTEELLSNAVGTAAETVFSYCDTELFVSANKGQLSQLVINLCKNASDAMGDAHGKIIVETRRPSRREIAELSAALPQPGIHFSGTPHTSINYACVRVTDTGPGIAPDILKQIFDPFFTTKGRRRATGLGLSVVHSVVESLGGFVIVESTVGTGTTFSVFLPLAGRRLPTVMHQQKPESVAGRERILIVDDEADIADSLALSLDRLGYDALAVIDPEDALDAVRADPEAWDGIIADQIMPKISGVELVRRVTAIAPHIISVICTASPASDVTEDCDININARLRKPIAPADVARELRANFDRKQLR